MCYCFFSGDIADRMNFLFYLLKSEHLPGQHRVSKNNRHSNAVLLHFSKNKVSEFPTKGIKNIVN